MYSLLIVDFFVFKQKTAYEMRISDWSSDVCSSDLAVSEAGLVYVARHRNLMISLLMVGIQIALSFALILAARAYQLPELVAAAAPAVALLVALGLASVLKARLRSPIQLGRASCRDRGCQYV